MNQPSVKSGPALLDSFARDVRRGLSGTPKTLPPRYFYDVLGSSLFDAICCLPWYEVTRAEKRLLERHAAAIAAASGAAFIAELGPGNGEKLALLSGAFTEHGRDLGVHLIDISGAALALARERFAVMDGVTVSSACATYEEGLRGIPGRRGDTGSALVLMLGSNIGNFEPIEAAGLLARVREALNPGDAFLLGADLVKPAAALQLAYDDPLGVTAAFNLNLLERINRELGANFDLAEFAHRARWNGADSRVEMHLISMRDQIVEVPLAGLQVSFPRGESIHTESSYKFQSGDLRTLGEQAGFQVASQWIDEPAQFSLTLFTTA